MTHEQGLLAEYGLDRLAWLDRRQVDLDRRQRQHGGRRVHLVDERIKHRDAADASEAHRRDVDEVAAPDSFVRSRTDRVIGMLSRRHHNPLSDSNRMCDNPPRTETSEAALNDCAWAGSPLTGLFGLIAAPDPT